MFAAGCATQTQFGMEAPGRPAVTWQSEDGAPSQTTDASREDTERQLLAELRDAEAKGADDLALADTLYNLAILRRQQGQLDEAEQLYRRALTIREQHQGPNHPDVATVLNNLAALEAALGHYDAARPLLERALSIRQTALGGDHVLTAESLNNLALLNAAQGNAGDAEPLYNDAVAILEKKGDRQRGALERVLDNYAALLYDTGRDAEAKKIEARALGLRAAREAPPPDPSR